MSASPARETYTNIVHEAEVDGGWSGQLRIVIGQGQSEQRLVFVDSDLLGPRRLVLTPEEALAVASSLIAADHASGREGPRTAAPATGYVYDTVRREHRAPDQTDVDIVRGLLDLMAGFADNDQRARYLLSSNWLRDRGAAAAARLQAVSVAEFSL